MGIQLEDRVMCSPAVLATDLSAQTVLMSVESGSYYGLSATSQEIWRRLQTPQNVRQLCAELSVAYQAPLAQVEADTLAFLDYLDARGLITRAPMP